MELIDTCWDVNEDKEHKMKSLDSELIDTCWDVNRLQRIYLFLTDGELIDTCWDVNMYEGLDEHSPSKRINRYMLGCKSVKNVAASLTE